MIMGLQGKSQPSRAGADHENGVGPLHETALFVVRARSQQPISTGSGALFVSHLSPPLVNTYSTLDRALANAEGTKVTERRAFCSTAQVNVG
jgi:hypothetical protein